MHFLIGDTQLAPLTVTYTKSLSQLGACIKATFANSDRDPSPIPEIGDALYLHGADWWTVFDGTVTEVQATPTKISVTAYDSCYYLNKSKITIQFSAMLTSEALAALWKQCGIINHRLPEMTHQIEAVFYAQAPADIAKKLISDEQDANGGEYYMTSNSFNSVDVYELGELDSGIEITAEIMSPSRSETLEGVRNRVTLLIADGENISVSETASDNVSIEKYGLLQEYVNISADVANAVAMAQNRLSRLSALLAEGEITIAGDWKYTVVGQRITVNEPVTGLVGIFIVESVTHSYSEMQFTTTLKLREYHKYSTFKSAVTGVESTALDAVAESRAGAGSEPQEEAIYLPYASQQCRLTSCYGYRTHPITGQKNSFHGGIDLVGITTTSGFGSTVVAVRGGRVVQSRIVTNKSDATWQWGNYVAILGDDGTTIYYCHLAARSVHVGDYVEKGTAIGIEGSTGQSTGQHLHFECRRNGERINAASYLGIENATGVYIGTQRGSHNSVSASIGKIIGGIG